MESRFQFSGRDKFSVRFGELNFINFGEQPKE